MKQKQIQNPSMLQKNETYPAEITDLTPDGNGVCHIQGMAVFVPHTAPGDQLQVKIVKVLKQYAFGIAVKIETPAACRIEPDCSFSACGGCTFRHITYAAELQWKEKLVQDESENYIRPFFRLSAENIAVITATKHNIQSQWMQTENLSAVFMPNEVIV